ncbi:hypothetical protein AUQ48_11290 [Kocuria flava]|uniref:Metallo-beta-lactamase domain-containing protein n=1 Tax=Kocuria flava TaxID=446860 RepID=A0A2N4T3C7_9MICC|nr:ComEC/Rec2 family competence protein [Kocuria flava]PLC12696.1 hypothetical protein AUQ48_11290 [Kocuria flava]
MSGPARRWARALEHQEHRDARAPGRTWDLRLLPAALTSWVTALLATTGPGPLPAAAGAAACLALLAAVSAAAPPLAARALARLRGTPRTVPPRPGTRTGPAWSALALAALAAAAVLLGAVADGRATTGGPLGDALAEGGTLAVTARVLEAPRPWSAAPAAPGTVPAGPGAAPSDGEPAGRAPWDAGEERSGVVVELALEEVVHDARRARAGTTATVFAQGPAWADLRPGQRLTAVLAARPGTAGTAPVLRAAAAPTVVPGPEPGARERLRARFTERTDRLGPDAAGLLPGMTFGERAGLDPALEQAMRDTGLTHLTAVSGANCALVAVLAGRGALALGAGRRTCLLAGLGAVGCFVVLVGPDPSVLRAATMGGLAALALLTGRPAVSLATLGAAVTVLLVVRPGLAAEYGFVLSVLATAGIVVSARPLTRLLGTRVPELLGTAVAVPAVAQLWCAPVLVLLQPAVPVYALPANVLSAPVVPLVTVCGLLGLALLALPDGAGETAALVPLTAGGLAARLVAGTARGLAAAPGALAPWPTGAGGAVLMAGLSAAVLLAVHALDLRRRRPRPTAGRLRGGPAPPSRPEEHWRARDRTRRRRAAAAALLVALVAAAALRAAHLERRPPPAWEALVCDVGQGDALLLRTGPARAVLVDTGPDPRALERCLRRAGIDRLDLVVLSHAHADHTGGLPALARGPAVTAVWYSTAAAAPPPELAAALPGVPAATPAPGTVRDLGPLRLTVLAPDPPRRPGAGTAPDSAQENNASLVLRAELTGPGGTGSSWLLAGDLQEEGARALLRRAPGAVDVDVLKLSHHGARNGGTAIIDASRPRLAVASVGADNPYGHPHPAVLGHLERLGVPLVRTDRHGPVWILREGPRLRAVPADG